MKKRHHVAVQMEEEQQWQKDNGPIVKTADQLWKYSGEIEDSLENLEQYDLSFIRYYKKRIKEKNIYILLNKKESIIIDYFYKNCNSSLKQISKDLQISLTKISQIISKHLKIIKNDKKNTG